MREQTAGYSYSSDTMIVLFVEGRKPVPFNSDVIRYINTTEIPVIGDDGEEHMVTLHVQDHRSSGPLTQPQEKLGWRREVRVEVEYPVDEGGTPQTAARAALTALADVGKWFGFKVEPVQRGYKPETRKASIDHFKSAASGASKSQVKSWAGLSLRVAARFENRIAYGQEGKFLGRDCRLTWTRDGWTLEELPVKGKKKLKVATLQNPTNMRWGDFDAYLDGNILRDAGLSASDSYEAIKQKMLDAYELAAELTINKMPDQAKHALWLRDLKWYENEIHYLKVTPEDTEPFEAEGKDYTIKVQWAKFSAYSPDSDFQQSDPYYTQYAESSAQGARKLYQILKADPNALKSVPWSKLGDWLSKNKIPYKTNFSQWH